MRGKRWPLKKSKTKDAFIDKLEKINAKIDPKWNTPSG